MKTIIQAVIAFAVFLLYSLYVPIFYNYFQDTYGLDHNNMVSVFFACMILWVVLLAIPAVIILSKHVKDF